MNNFTFHSLVTCIFAWNKQEPEIEYVEGYEELEEEEDMEDFGGLAIHNPEAGEDSGNAGFRIQKKN